MDLVLIDGSNVYNTIGAHLVRSAPNHNGEIRSYLTDWFDFDRLVTRTMGEGNPTLGSVIFHSEKQLGRDPYKLTNEYVRDFWARQGANPNSSCMAVDIPGDQRESYLFKCEGCGKDNAAVSNGEKGVDNAMTVYMFESFDRWERLLVFSRDVDFVPAVWALRRRGKRVFVATDADEAKTALVGAAQSICPLPWQWIHEDFGMFLFLRSGGVLDAWIDRTHDPAALAVSVVVEPDIFTVATSEQKGKDALDILAREVAVLPGLNNWVTPPSGEVAPVHMKVGRGIDRSRKRQAQRWSSHVVRHLGEAYRPNLRQGG